MFGHHGLCGLPEEGAHEKSPKCLGGNLGDFGGILQRSLFGYKDGFARYLSLKKKSSENQNLFSDDLLHDSAI